MPNWVYNGLTIEGSPDSVKKLMEQMNQPFTLLHNSWDVSTQSFVKKNTLYPNPVFAFWNIVKPTDLEAYLLQPAQSKLPTTHDDWWSDTQEIAKTDDSWYNWNMRNWGVKWDVAVSADDTYPDTNMEDTANGDNHVVHYNFETAWGIPLTALEKLSAQYPSLLFTLSYEEETGWGGQMELLRGKVISQSEYDSMCRDCDATDTLEYCENDCGEICSACHWLGEADLEAVAECGEHKIYLDTKVPEYRKVQA